MKHALQGRRHPCTPSHSTALRAGGLQAIRRATDSPHCSHVCWRECSSRTVICRSEADGTDVASSDQQQASCSICAEPVVLRLAKRAQKQLIHDLHQAQPADLPSPIAVGVGLRPSDDHELVDAAWWAETTLQICALGPLCSWEDLGFILKTLSLFFDLDLLPTGLFTDPVRLSEATKTTLGRSEGPPSPAVRPGTHSNSRTTSSSDGSMNAPSSIGNLTNSTDNSRGSWPEDLPATAHATTLGDSLYTTLLHHLSNRAHFGIPDAEVPGMLTSAAHLGLLPGTRLGADYSCMRLDSLPEPLPNKLSGPVLVMRDRKDVQVYIRDGPTPAAGTVSRSSCQGHAQEAPAAAEPGALAPEASSTSVPDSPPAGNTSISRLDELHLLAMQRFRDLLLSSPLTEAQEGSGRPFPLDILHDITTPSEQTYPHVVASMSSNKVLATCTGALVPHSSKAISAALRDLERFQTGSSQAANADGPAGGTPTASARSSSISSRDLGAATSPQYLCPLHLLLRCALLGLQSCTTMRRQLWRAVAAGFLEMPPEHMAVALWASEAALQDGSMTRTAATRTRSRRTSKGGSQPARTRKRAPTLSEGQLVASLYTQLGKEARPLSLSSTARLLCALALLPDTSPPHEASAAEAGTNYVPFTLQQGELQRWVIKQGRGVATLLQLPISPDPEQVSAAAACGVALCTLHPPSGLSVGCALLHGLGAWGPDMPKDHMARVIWAAAYAATSQEPGAEQQPSPAAAVRPKHICVPPWRWLAGIMSSYPEAAVLLLHALHMLNKHIAERPGRATMPLVLHTWRRQLREAVLRWDPGTGEQARGRASGGSRAGDSSHDGAEPGTTSSTHCAADPPDAQLSDAQLSGAGELLLGHLDSTSSREAKRIRESGVMSRLLGAMEAEGAPVTPPTLLCFLKESSRTDGRAAAGGDEGVGDDQPLMERRAVAERLRAALQDTCDGV